VDAFGALPVPDDGGLVPASFGLPAEAAIPHKPDPQTGPPWAKTGSRTGFSKGVKWVSYLCRRAADLGPLARKAVKMSGRIGE
jgi:hypothetical protein